MRRFLVPCLALVWAALGALPAVHAQVQPAPSAARTPAPPATDIFVARLMLGPRPAIGTVANATRHGGYDNQPSFTPDGRAFLFTSIRDGGQADIYRYDLATRATTRVTHTPESEYSAAVAPAGDAFTVVRVERDSTQRLWRFPLDGGEPSLVLEGVKPVGYYAWADEHTLALFVLGSPNTLQLADLRTGRADTIATNIGRSLHRVPGTNDVSFVQKSADREAWITILDPAARTVSPLVKLPEGTEDYVWTPKGDVLAAQGSTLLFWRRGDAGWTEIADLGPAGIHAITRIAVNPVGDVIAFVAEARR